MRKLTIAAVAAALSLSSPLAQAATVFNFTFTGGLASLGDPASVNGTGKVTVDGLTGSGFESATKGGLPPIITDIDINMSQYHLAFGDIATASLFTQNGNFVSFAFTGQDTIHNVPFEFATLGSDSFAASNSGPKYDGYIGGFTVTSEAIGTVPEPATWAMLVLGFGGIGAMLRLARRRQNRQAAAL